MGDARGLSFLVFLFVRRPAGFITHPHSSFCTPPNFHLFINHPLLRNFCPLLSNALFHLIFSVDREAVTSVTATCQIKRLASLLCSVLPRDRDGLSDSSAHSLPLSYAAAPWPLHLTVITVSQLSHDTQWWREVIWNPLTENLEEIEWNSMKILNGKRIPDSETKTKTGKLKRWSLEGVYFRKEGGKNRKTELPLTSVHIELLGCGKGPFPLYFMWKMSSRVVQCTTWAAGWGIPVNDTVCAPELVVLRKKGPRVLV